ncbi:hypothetical protein GCM10028806_59830 [Spirosoma terrae]|uniref:Response regulator transcription factor n=1 Tax=Spirosoma terrae TaxID=1968276 RepID=A0A6L9LGU9_9BACT|nr:response regulator transcription factor [Spirosoma terrae]NDU98451.1 response regulator transcription factor [Spirosoma terrae]
MNPKYHLLIVDENPYVADILIQTLKADFTVTVAHTGHEAARLLIQGNRFDCVVTELDLPVFSGLELTKLIRMSKLIFQTPVIILSNVPDSNTRIECLEQGVDSYITKPFNPLEVKAKIHAILRRTATSQEPVQQTNASASLQAEDKSFWPTKSKIFSALFRSTLVAQSA